MFRILVLALFALASASVNAGEASCVSTAVKSGKVPCGDISATRISTGSKSIPPRAAPAQAEPAAGTEVPIGVVLKVTAGEKSQSSPPIRGK